MPTWTKIDDEDRTEDPPLPELWVFDSGNEMTPRALELFVERSVNLADDRQPTDAETWTGRVVIGGEVAPDDCAASPHDQEDRNATPAFCVREEAQQATLLLAAERLEDLAQELRRAYIAAIVTPAVSL